MRYRKRRTKRPLSANADEARPEAFPPNVHASKARRPLGVSYDTTPPPQLRRTTGRRRRRSSSIARTVSTALTLAVLGSVPAQSWAIDLSPGASAAHAPSASNPRINNKNFGGTTTTSPSSRLCTPPEGARAYVTTLASDSGGEAGGGGNGGLGDAALGLRVLAQSLRSAGAKGDIVVLVPLDRYTGTSVDALRRDGLTVHIVPRGLQSAGGEIVSDDLMTKVFLWNLTAYDRVVYLDPRSLIQKNPDALFTCEGFCAAGAVTSIPPPFDPSAQATVQAADGKAQAPAPIRAEVGQESLVPTPPPWQPSTSVMVLEPSIEVHVAMLDELTRTPDVGSLESQAFLSSFLSAAGDKCEKFRDLEAGGGRRSTSAEAGRKSGRGSAGWGGVGGAVGGWIEEDDFFGAEDGIGRGGGGGGDFLEDAFMPKVLLKGGASLPRCTGERERTPAGKCYQLPYTYAAPSTHLHAKGNSRLREKATEAHIIHFADEDTPLKRLAYLHKPLFWKWNHYREQLEYPYGNFFPPWVLFFIPCVVLAFARVYYKTAGGANVHGYTGGRGGGAIGGSGSNVAAVSGTASYTADNPSPSKRRLTWFRGRKREQQQRRQVAILPECSMATAYDGGAVGGSLETSTKYRRSSEGAVGTGGWPGGGAPLPTGAFFALSALVSAFGFVWFRATRSLAREIVDVSWHPLISVAVYNAWLCCGLVVGLYLLDFVYYSFLTRGRTFLRDSVAVAIFVSGVYVLHSSNSGGLVWAAAIGAGVIALGVGHGSRPSATHQLSSRVHFRCIAASCAAGTAISLAMCYNGATAHRVASPHAHAAAATAQMVFTALVYASVVSGVRVSRLDPEDAGSKIVRSCSAASFVGDTLMAPDGSFPEGRGVDAASASETRSRCGRTAAWMGMVRGLAWVREALWRRRRVAACVLILAMWKICSSLVPRTPDRRFEVYGNSCLESQDGYVQAGSKGLSRECGAEQGLRPVSTGTYFEAFRQDKVCLEVAGGGYLTLGRVHVAETCTPQNHFVFQQIQSPRTRARAKAGSPDALSSAPAAGSPDSGVYCLYNPASGRYLSTTHSPQVHCQQDEQWRVTKAPLAPGQKNPPSGASLRVKPVSMLLHPNYLSHGPLRTVYGYLLAATTVLVARTIFAKLLETQNAVDAKRGGGGRGGVSCGGGGLYRQRHGGLATRQRSRGRKHSRPSNSAYVGDNGYIGDPGYAGDAEASSSNYGGGGSGGNTSSSSNSSRGRLSQHSFGSSDDLRALSESPVARARMEQLGWRRSHVTFEGMKELGDEGDEPVEWASKGLERASSKEKKVRFWSTDAARIAQGGSGGDRSSWTASLLRGLCLACDATLLAGLWCLAPAHFAQLLSALTHDHHSAITQGLGTNSPVSNINADFRNLEESAGGNSNGSGGSLRLLGLPDADGGEEGLVPSCHSEAWSVLATLVRWHLMLLLVAFCHLHLAVAAAAAAGRGRNRRTGRKMTERASFWGLKAGERLSMRLRTALGVLTLLCAVATSVGAGLGERGGGVIFLGLHAHPAWGKCAASVGLDDSWGVVSPLLVFAVLAASAGVYVRAGSSTPVRLSAVIAHAVTIVVIWIAAGRAYLVLALVAAGMDWAAWGIAGVLSCVCYRDVGDNSTLEEIGVLASGGEQERRGRGVAGPAGSSARHRSGNDARRMSRERSRSSAADSHGGAGVEAGRGSVHPGAGLVFC